MKYKNLTKGLEPTITIKPCIKASGTFVNPFTGYLDKNGKEVFANDVLMFVDNHIYKVLWALERKGYHLYRRAGGKDYYLLSHNISRCTLFSNEVHHTDVGT